MINGTKNVNLAKADTILATWISHSANSLQVLELKDSTNALVYWFRSGNQKFNIQPYYFKANGKVKQWDRNKLTVQTDKYNLYYDIWDDTLILRDEAGIIEKLIRVYNDSVGRSVLY